MSLLVTGSIGLDTVETPAGRREQIIGGSAVYFAYAASFFTPVRLVGVVGEDCPKSLFTIFEGRDVDTSGLETRKGSKTFRWHGSYVKDLNEAVSVQTDLNILGEQGPKIPPGFVDSKYVFLANSHPILQQQRDCTAIARVDPHIPTRIALMAVTIHRHAANSPMQRNKRSH